MAKVLPFKAVRPTRDKVSLIASRAYQSYTQEEREARLNNNPFSFLHIVNPGYKYHKEISGVERYKLVKNRYEEFKEEGIFIQDSVPSYYIYKIVDRDNQSYEGIIAATSAIEYEEDKIKKHEDTLEEREIIFKDYLKTVGFNAEPVLITYPDNNLLEEIIKENSQTRAEYEFTTTYRDTHYLWKVDNPKIINTIKKEFGRCKNLYIADGHHRSASSYLLHQDLKSSNEKHTGEENYNFFMSYLIPESQLTIYEFNRLVKDLNGHSKEEFLIALDTFYKIENRGLNYYKPSKPHHFSMYLSGEFYSLQLRSSSYKFENALDDLDAQILYKTILKPLLGINNLRNNNRIEYVHGRNDMAFVKAKVDSKEFEVGFGLKPATIDQLKHIADQGLKMPPKSTYIEPKLRSGITIYEF
tara:strand:- start:8102 stop:9340 length:1239 start_codon:yes stop_codon:yes gene_type:complete